MIRVGQRPERCRRFVEGELPIDYWLDHMTREGMDHPARVDPYDEAEFSIDASVLFPRFSKQSMRATLLVAENDDVPFGGRRFGAAAPGDGDEDETVADGDITRRHRRLEGADNPR